MSRVLPYGSWPSAFTARRLGAGALRLGLPRQTGDEVTWVEGRPAEGGREVVVAVRAGEEPRELSPEGVSVRSRVHEYGGGSWLRRDDRLLHVDFASQRLHDDGRPVSPEGAKAADPALSPDGRSLVWVEERPREGAEPENRLVASSSDVEAPIPICEGHDFVSSPVFSPAGDRLAFLAWDHPNMPWNETILYEVAWSAGAAPGSPRRVAGGSGESIFQPSYSPAGALTWASDRSGWWNLEQERGGERHALCPREAEFGRPQWVFGMRTHAHLDDRPATDGDAGRILCVVGERCFERVAILEAGELSFFDLPYTNIASLDAEGGRACLIGTGPTRATEIVSLDLESGETEVLRRCLPESFGPEILSQPEELVFESEGGRTAYAFFYPPHSADCEGPADELPPLLVKSHGGPTAATFPALDLRIQYWTSRGFAVVDVNYGGSTGYGREYRDRLDGEWGVVDVEDCVHAARVLAEQGKVDPSRMAISGGSAGGYTTLCALTFHDVFSAGASHYGIGDLEALARDTHKFESRYTDRLVAPYPEGREIYRERSPIHFTERLSCPVIFFQGLEDQVVPPNQAEAMVEALARRGIRHAYVPFEGEQHGFRRAENIRTALDGELYFYSRVFGFEVEEAPSAVRIVDSA